MPSSHNSHLITPASSLTREQLYYRHQLSHDQIDDLLGEKKSQEYPESKAQHLAKLKVFLELSELFRRESIEFIPLKGPVLSFRLFGDPLYRSYNDLDFFVDVINTEKVIKLLIDKNYISTDLVLPKTSCRWKLLFNHIHEVYLFNPEFEIGVEIHWNLFSINIIPSKKVFSLIRNYTTHIHFKGIDFTIFTTEFELLFLIIHGSLHGWNKLKWLYDIKVISEQFSINKAIFHDLTLRLRCGRLVSACNELVKIYFPDSALLPQITEAPGKMISYSVDQITSSEEQKTSVWFIKTYLNWSRSFPGLKFFLRNLQQMFFATDLVSAKWMPCTPVFHYIVGPFWKIFRGFR